MRSQKAVKLRTLAFILPQKLFLKHGCKRVAADCLKVMLLCNYFHWTRHPFQEKFPNSRRKLFMLKYNIRIEPGSFYRVRFFGREFYLTRKPFKNHVGSSLGLPFSFLVYTIPHSLCNVNSFLQKY